MILEERQVEACQNDDEWMKSQFAKIPNKLSFRIGEVSKLLSVQPYVLRYWESEFEQLKPSKLDNKQRLYFHKDIETLLLIKKLLYKDGFSIRGAKQALKSLRKVVKRIKTDDHMKQRVNQEADDLMESISRLRHSL